MTSQFHTNAMQVVVGAARHVMLLAAMAVWSALSAGGQTAAQNPVIWADVPDPSVVRVGDAYYMSSTTMHVNPGVPIMRSTDLTNWEIVSYAYDVLADTDKLALRNGEEAYGEGSWASSIRYRDGVFYVVTFSYSTGRTHIYRTTDIENGPWEENTLPVVYHDPALFFDDDGAVYLIHGINDIRIIELTSDLRSVRSGGVNRVLIPNSSAIAGTQFIVSSEGSHVHKVDGQYYVFLISWPQGGMRTQLVYRSDSLTGTYEGRIVLQDAGIAQGGLIDTPEGDWYALLFQDSGAVGRIPWLIPVQWEDGWPVLGENGRAPRVLDLPTSTGLIPGIVASDEFEVPAQNGEPWLALVWQWNHNPVDDLWSLTDRPGFLRLTNGRIDGSFVETQNTLTQRTYGPQSSAHVALETAGMKDGDVAGLGALQANYGFVGVRVEGAARYVVMTDGSRTPPVEVASVRLDQDRVYLRIDADFRNRTDRARFFYSLDGATWEPIGTVLQMSYTLPHFMGYRFALFSYAARETDGYADFDFYRTGHTYEESVPSDIGGNNDTEAAGIMLGSNYPNPFAEKTTIRYAVSSPDHVRIDVYDALGRRILTAVDGEISRGRHAFTFDARGLASGPYFYRLSSGSVVTSRSMLVVR